MTARSAALVLSGGGAKTAAHLGAYRALREAGFEPAWYVATSMGAVVAAGLASGVSGDELLELIAEVGPSGVVREPLAAIAGLFGRSLLKPTPLRRAIETLVPARRFADLAVPLTVSAVDLDTGELVLFGAGAQTAPLIDVLCASCALPMYYPPVVLNGRHLGDGGLRGVVPLEPAAELAVELVLAVDVGPGFDDTESNGGVRVPPMVRAHDAAVGILMAANSEAQLALWRADPGRPPLVYVRPKVERNATFRVDRVREYAVEGRRATRDALERWGDS
ncbi:MAG TPA: patatin-like phospholipase family protein [Gemmatimonadales bacterium]|jgi:NTE family protein|nr:patatin-like phospholipase family protein [Gemmatimonadales bacterium]